MSARGPVGVLALQGGFAAHEAILATIGLEARRVRRAADLDGLAGLVLPGGESSTMLKLLAWSGLEEPLDAAVKAGLPVFATCAGAILAARHVEHPAQRSFGWVDIDVARNAFGRQVHSFEAESDAVPGAPADAPPFRLVFIRAPRILRVGDGVEVVAAWQGEPIAVRQGQVLVATFHPELAGDPRLHRLLFAPDTIEPQPKENPS